MLPSLWLSYRARLEIGHNDQATTILNFRAVNWQGRMPLRIYLIDRSSSIFELELSQQSLGRRFSVSGTHS